MQAPLEPLSNAELKAALGKSCALWEGLISEVSRQFPKLRTEWKPSKLEFGRVCLLKQKDRTLLYLIPRTSGFEVSVVLGERAVAIAMASDLPQALKDMLSKARPYAEGRGIRFPVTTSSQIPTITKLVLIKTTPR